MFFFLKPIKWAFKLVSLLVFAAVVFVVVSAVGVVHAESEGTPPAGAKAIVVTGSSVVGTAPGPDLLGRLQAALTLARAHTAPLLVVAGPGPSGASPGVPSVAGDWLRAEGVNGGPSSLAEVATSNANEFSAVAQLLGKGQPIVIVTDAVDARWALNAAAAAGLHASASIVPGTKKLFLTELGPLAREASGVAAGHLIGPEHAVWAAN
ncbi:MAG TPA: YdcF family protein [Acidimicrobiales bacterium]|nr:YdcF family protein [Acidimicrobiales bacterium]